MPKTVSASITLEAKSIPAGAIPGNLRVWLLSVAGGIIDQQDTADVSITFKDIAAGSYTVMAVRLDGDGGALGDPVSSDPFTVADDSTVSIEVPVRIVVSVT